MDSVTLTAVRREITNSKRGLRRGGFIPGVLYGKGIGSIPLAVGTKEFAKSLTTGAGTNTIYNLVFATGAKEEGHLAMVKEIQKDSITGEFIHVDFHAISLAEKIHTKVPVVTTGEARGVKEGGILEHLLREIDVECLPANIPEHISIDITDLGIGDQVNVRDLPPLAGVRILSDAEAVILTVSAPRAAAEPAAPGGAREPDATGDEEGE